MKEIFVIYNEYQNTLAGIIFARAYYSLLSQSRTPVGQKFLSNGVKHLVIRNPRVLPLNVAVDCY